MSGCVDHRLPFGRHQNKPLAEVPADYLGWLLREAKLSSGLRSAVAGELERRGLVAPPQPEPRPAFGQERPPQLVKVQPVDLGSEPRLSLRDVGAAV